MELSITGDRSSGWRYLPHVTSAGNHGSTFPLFPPLSEESLYWFPHFPVSVPALPPSVPSPSQGGPPPLPCRYPRVPDPVPRISPFRCVLCVLHGCYAGSIKENRNGVLKKTHNNPHCWCVPKLVKTSRRAARVDHRRRLVTSLKIVLASPARASPEGSPLAGSTRAGSAALPHLGLPDLAPQRFWGPGSPSVSHFSFKPARPGDEVST